MLIIDKNMLFKQLCFCRIRFLSMTMSVKQVKYVLWYLQSIKDFDKATLVYLIEGLFPVKQDD